MTKTVETHVTLNDAAGSEDFELEVEVSICSAEPDVGIMSDYIDEWRIISVNGNRDKDLCQTMDTRISDELGDDTFMDQLIDEGATDIDYPDDDPHDLDFDD